MRNGFSLVELAIVLVVLGLLTGGILGGQSMIKAAELRSVSTDYSRYVAAFSSFNDQYGGLPGDLINATGYWGTDAGGCPGNNASATAPGVPTCNGDGNGQIQQAAATANEIYRSWQHLSNAGLIEGTFTGVPNSATTTAFAVSTTTPNVPASRYSSGVWHPYYIGSITYADSGLFEGSYGNMFYFGAPSGNGRTVIMVPEDAWNMDKKIDDGKPGTGIMTTRKTAAEANSATGCSNVNYTTASSIAAASEYLLSNTSVICSVQFKTGL